ncbi:hypothetical protein NDU88_000431 [Pleurodeles waltl]|uniref:Uncharacterized protein n=1 Tax=Pleurodeles waltl TaxID=8319 RepID=A0AAV7KM24_PLEWA|nr:hypothetical protein NDU88_000431 [Pleurodeles waltl]
MACARGVERGRGRGLESEFRSFSCSNFCSFFLTLYRPLPCSAWRASDVSSHGGTRRGDHPTHAHGERNIDLTDDKGDDEVVETCFLLEENAFQSLL